MQKNVKENNMAEVRQIRVDQKDAETGYLELCPVVAELVKVISNQASQGYGLYNIRDFTGQEICVLLRGRGRPTQNDVGKIAVFAISGQTDGNKVKYSGFYNPKDEIPPQYQGKRPPQPAGETAGGGGSRGVGKSGGNRGFALSYAKDLACAGAISVKQLQYTATIFTAYLDTGEWPKTYTAAPQEQAPVERPVEETIPEMGAEQTGGFDDQYPQEADIGGSGGGGATFTGEGGLGGDDVPF